MPICPRRSLWPGSLLCAGALTLGLILPISASARPTRPPNAVAEKASRAEERTSRNEERAARAQERATRAEERATLRATRAQERAARRSARRGSARDQPVESSDPPGETGASPPLPESSTNPSGKCQASIDASSHRITAGETVSVFGKLTCPTGASAAGQQVAVYQRQSGAGASSFSMVGTATTEADGSYKLTPAAFNTNTIFRVREGNHGARTAVKVAPLVTLSGPTPGAHASALSHSLRSGGRTRATFTGTVSPADTGALVALQVDYVAAGEQWRTVAFGHVGSDGSYSITHRFRTPGELMIRTVAHTGRLNVPAASEPLSYQAPQPQNRQLTIQTSADPISYGPPVTISGVAAGAAHQSVTLLAQTQGSAVAVVAKGTTDESGNYTFTQVPLQNTSYRVTDATTTSTTLFEA